MEKILLIMTFIIQKHVKYFETDDCADSYKTRWCSNASEMALLLKKLYRGYFWLFTEKTDPRTDDLFLMSSPLQPFFLAILYLHLIYKVLPKFMKDRPPYKLDLILIIFNLTQVILNAVLVFYGSQELMNLNWLCAPVDYSETPHNRFLVRLFYLYFILKVADLLDTVFFILRKKSSQVSFLHVYHHFGMIGLVWTGVRFLAGGHSIFLGVVNSFVHTVMYFYYLLTIWKPEYKKSIWWKKHITQIQLIQFVFFFFLYGQILFRSDCNYPKLASYFIVPQSAFMMILFSDFYWKAYIKPNRKALVE